MNQEQVYKITHYYNKRPEYAMKIVSKENPKNFALYIQLMSEKWFDESICLETLVIADVLIKFYGCRLPTETEFYRIVKSENIIDMYSDRENLFCCRNNLSKYDEIIESDKYPRKGLKEYLQKIQDNGNYLGELTYPKHYTEFQSFKNLSLSEQKFIFEKMQYSIKETEERENNYFNMFLETNRQNKRFKFTLQIALLYLFNRNDEKDETLLHIIQDALISTEQENQPEDIIKLIQEHCVLGDLFQGDIINNKKLERAITNFLIKNSHNEIDF